MAQVTPLSVAKGGHYDVEPSVAQKFTDCIQKYPDRLAVACLQQDPNLYGIANQNGDVGSGYLRWTYSQLDSAVERLCAGLKQQGIVQGDRIITYLDNRVELILLLQASFRLQCPIVLLHRPSLNNDEETAHIFSLVQPRVIVVDKVSSADKFEGVHNKCMTPSSIKVLVGEDGNASSWLPFGHLMKRNDSEAVTTNGSDSPASPLGPNVVAVLFTSGTTSVPKGVPHTDGTLNAFSRDLRPNDTPGEQSVFCSSSPNNHGMGFFFILHHLMYGGAVIYPDFTFNAIKSIEAIEKEKVTHAAFVPAMLHSLSEVLDERSDPLQSHLKDVGLAGSSISAGDVRFVLERLRSAGASPGFGMAEGSPAWNTPKSSVEDLVFDDSIISGPPAPGASVKICAPNSREPVPRGEIGELHQAGPGLVASYLGTPKDNACFYVDDDGVSWFLTGDQAVMLHDGRVSITGRYKDTITRGGKKISPATLEEIVEREFDEDVQAVALADGVGEDIPVVIRRNRQGAADAKIREAIVKAIGPNWANMRFVELKDLGLDTFPMTESGKILKRSLIASISAMDERNNAAAESADENAVTTSILRAYSRASSIPTSDLDTHSPITSFTDSISLMRVRRYLAKSGYPLTLSDMLKHTTISEQAQYLQRKGLQKSEANGVVKANVSALSMDDLAITAGGEEKSKALLGAVSEVLGPKGFSLDDVRSIIPAQDYIRVLSKTKIIDDWNFCMTFLTSGYTVETLRAALERCLANHPLLSSFFVKDADGNGFYAAMKPAKALWDLCIVHHEDVATSKEAEQLAESYPHADHARVPGPMFRCLVLHVKETNSAAMVWQIHHSVYDASSARLFLEDIEQSLASPDKPLPAHIDFQIWADLFQSVRHSPAADFAVDWHVKRLSDLHNHKSHLFPAEKNPRQAVFEVPNEYEFEFDCPNLLKLRTKYPNMTANTVVKAAMALVSVSHTKHTHALFNNIEGGRGEFPFLPTSTKALGGFGIDSANVTGPTMQGVCNVVEVARQSTAINFLNYMQDEQLELTKHAHAPLLRIYDALRAQGNGADEVATAVHEAMFLTWAPGLLGDYEAFKLTHLAVKSTTGLALIAGTSGSQATTLFFSIKWDGGNFSFEKTQEFGTDLQTAIEWLAEPDNWDKHLGAVLDKFKR